MFKPAKIRDFNTLAIHKKPTTETVNGRTRQIYIENGNLKGLFKLKGTSEINANGVLVVNDKTSFITWWKTDLASGDILNIRGVDYQIIGTPENVELRGRYAIINLEKIGGGA